MRFYHEASATAGAAVALAASEALDERFATVPRPLQVGDGSLDLSLLLLLIGVHIDDSDRVEFVAEIIHRS